MHIERNTSNVFWIQLAVCLNTALHLFLKINNTYGGSFPLDTQTSVIRRYSGRPLCWVDVPNISEYWSHSPQYPLQRRTVGDSRSYLLFTVQLFAECFLWARLRARCWREYEQQWVWLSLLPAEKKDTGLKRAWLPSLSLFQFAFVFLHIKRSFPCPCTWYPWSFHLSDVHLIVSLRRLVLETSGAGLASSPPGTGKETHVEGSEVTEHAGSV